MFCAGLLLSIADLLTHDWPSNKHSAHATACSVRLPACRRNKGGHPAVPVPPSLRKAAPPASSSENHTASGCAFQLTFSSGSPITVSAQVNRLNRVNRANLDIT